MDEMIQVAMAADAKYKRQLAVTLSSLASVQPPGTCVVTVLHPGIDKRDRDRIEAGAVDSLELQWMEVSPEAVRDFHYISHLTATTLFRLMLADLLPELDRMIYLDSDIVVLRPLTELWLNDLEDNLVGAVRDASSPWAAGPVGTHWRELGVAPDTPYFNAGVLLIPLSAWRKEGVGSAALDIVRVKTLVYGEQDALNAVIEGRWLEVPRHWNVQTWDWGGQGTVWAIMRDEVESALAEPAIIHYTSPGRPWWPGSPHPKSDLWFEYLDRTPWSGWRPPARRPMWYEAASRIKQAGRVLVKGT